MLFLANEGTFAVLAMTLALTVALAGVFSLGAYVLYCDRKNRLGEADLASAEEGSNLHEERAVPLQAHVVGESPAPSVAHLPEADPTAGDPAAPRPPRRRNRPPQGH